MKRRIPLLVVVALALVAYGVYRVRQAGKPFEWSGTVEARTIEVGSRVGGRVEQVHVREGDSVTAGQTLITLEKGDLPAQRLIAQGQLTQAEGALEKVASRTLPTARRAEIAEAQARVQAQAATAEKAKMDQARFRKLFEGGAGTRADADNATLAARNADAQASALRAQLDVLLHGTPQDVKSAEGLVEAARGRLQQIDVALDELTIRAPRAARVEALDLRPGDILAPNAAGGDAARARRALRPHLRARDADRSRPHRASRCRSPSTRSRADRSQGVVESHQPARASSRRATSRRPTSAPTRCSRRASRIEEATTCCAPAWRRWCRCRDDRRSTGCGAIARRQRRRARKFGDFVALDDVSLDGAARAWSTACSGPTARASRR